MLSKNALGMVMQDQRAELQQLKDTVPRSLMPKALKYRGKSALVVKGVRRCGKSTFLKQFMNARYKGKFHYFNFDDERILGFEAKDFQSLMEVFLETDEACKNLFFDEIQNVAGWELFVNRLLRSGHRVFITGSNANLLSEELGTHMTGRHVDIVLYPFSFPEFLTAKKAGRLRGPLSSVKKAGLARHFKEYLAYGGMPEAVVLSNHAVLSQVVDDILQKDIIRRYAVRKPNELRSVVRFLLANVANPVTFQALCENFGIKSPVTIQKYVSYSEEAYLLFTVNRYDKKLKRFDKNPKKIYAIDTGIVTKNAVAPGEQRGALLENMVAVELMRRGKPFFYYVNKNGTETDFVTTAKGSATRTPLEAFQVCLDASRPSTRAREEKALLRTLKETGLKKGTILTQDQEESKTVKEKKIRYLPVWKWLLG